MNEELKELLKKVKLDPSNEEILFQIEEIVTSQTELLTDPQILELMEETIDYLSKLEEWESVARVIEVALCIIPKDKKEKEIQLRKRLASIFYKELLLMDRAISEYNKILEIDPSNEEAKQRVDELKKIHEKWEEIVAKYIQEAEESTEDLLRSVLYCNAAELIYRNNPRQKKEIVTLLEKSLQHNPANYKAIKLYALLLSKKQRWNEIVDLYLNGVEYAQEDELKVKLLKEAAKILDIKLKDRDGASELFKKILEITPSALGPLTYLVDYYTEKEQWFELVELYKKMLKYHSKGDAEIANLLQIGMIYWKKLNDKEKAKEYFETLQKINPSHPGVISFFKEYYKEKEDWNKLLLILGDAYRTEKDEKRVSIAKEIALISEEKLENIDKAIEAWKNVARLSPYDKEAREALKRLYRKGEKWNLLIELLKEEVDRLSEEEKEEKIRLLKEMAYIYKEKLGLELMVINIYNNIIKLEPNDLETIEKLCNIYESMERYNDLLRVLELKLEKVTEKEEKKLLYMKIAQILITQFKNYNKAIQLLEKIIEIDPKDKFAKEKLKEIYLQKKEWNKLYQIMVQELDELEGDDKVERLKEIAQLATTKLNDFKGALTYWKEIFKLKPYEIEPLNNIEIISERIKDWDSLIWALEQKLERVEGEEKLKLLLKLGTIYESKISDIEKTISIWKRVLEIQPKNTKAIRVLKDKYIAKGDFDALEELYTMIGDFEGLATVLSEVADTHPQNEIKIKLSFRVAEIFEEKLNQPLRAQRSYEKILNIDPHNERAAKALLKIYEHNGQWHRMVKIYELLFTQVEKGSPQSIEFIEKLIEINGEKLNNTVEAFNWCKILYKLDPLNKNYIELLEKYGGLSSSWEDLIETYRKRIEETEDVQEKLMLLNKIANIYYSTLDSTEKALSVYKEILNIEPENENVRTTVESIYRSSKKWEELLESLYWRLEHGKDKELKRKIYKEIVSIYVDVLNDTDKAIATLNRMIEELGEELEILRELERLYESKGDWKKVAYILERERLFLEEIPLDLYIELLLKLGSIYIEKLGDYRSGFNIGKELLEISPVNPKVIELMERLLDFEETAQDAAYCLLPIYEEEGLKNKLVRVYEILVTASKDPSYKLNYLKKLSQLYIETKVEPQKSFNILLEILDINPTEPEVWNSLIELAVQLDKIPEVVQKLEYIYPSVKEKYEEFALKLAYIIADLYMNQLNAPDKAVPYYKEILKKEGVQSQAFATLEDIYTNQEKWKELISLYEEYIDNIVNIETQKQILLKICFVYEEILEEPLQAIEWYERVLRIDPQDQRANYALERIYEQVEKWEELLSLLLRRLEFVTDTEEKVAIWLKLGKLYEVKLNSPSQALNYYEQIVELNPDNEIAISSIEKFFEKDEFKLRVARILAPVYEKHKLWDKLCMVLDVQVESVQEDFEKIGLLLKLGDIKKDKLNDVRGSFEYYKRGFILDPTREDILSIIREITEKEGLWADYVVVLEKGISKLELTVGVPIPLLRELCSIYEEKLGDIDKAIASYNRLLEVASYSVEDSIKAIDSLENLYSLKEDWQNLIRILRIKLRYIEEEEERNAILLRIAEIQEALLEDLESTMETYREILSYSPKNIVALSALERLYTKFGNYRELIDILKEQLEIMEKPEEKKELYYRIAEVYKEKLGDNFNAILTYNLILSQFPNEKRGVESLILLFEQEGRWSELLEMYEKLLALAEKDEEKINIMYKIGELYHHKLENLTAAIKNYREILSIDKDHEPTIRALESLLNSEEKLTVAKLLSEIFEAKNDWEKYLSVLEIEIEESFDIERKLSLLKRASEVSEIGLSNYERAFGYLAKALKEGINTKEAPSIIRELERIVASSNYIEKLIDVYVSIIPDIYDIELQKEIILKVARLYKEQLRQLENGEKYYLKLLEIAPDNIEALDSLIEIYLSIGDYEKLLKIYRQKSEVITDLKEKKELLLQMAKISINPLQNYETAIECYEEVLRIEPLHKETIDTLIELYRRFEKWNKLVELLETKLEQQEHPTPQLYYELGEIYREKLNDLYKAIENYQKAIELDRNYKEAIDRVEEMLLIEDVKPQACSLLEPIYSLAMDWSKLVKVLKIKLEVTFDVEKRKEIITQIAEIYEVQMENLEEAFNTYLMLFKEEPLSRKVREKLIRLSGVLEKWDVLAEQFFNFIKDSYTVEESLIELALETGEIYDKYLSNIEKGVLSYKKILELDPNNKEAFRRIEELYKREKKWEELLSHYVEFLDKTYDDQKRKEFLFKIAELYEEKFSSPTKAIEYYQEILAIDEDEKSAILNLDRLYYQLERWEELIQLLEFQLNKETNPQTRISLMLRIGGIYEEKLKQLEKAIDWYEEILKVDPNNEQTISILERLILNYDYRYRIAKILEPIYQANDEWMKLVVIYDAQLEFITDPKERLYLLREIAKIHVERGGDFSIALNALGKALIENPENGEILEEFRRLAERLKAWELFIDTLEKCVDTVYDVEKQAYYWRLIARSYDRYLGDPRKAIDAYRKLLEIKEDDQEALDNLEVNYTMLGDWNGQVYVLKKKAEFTSDPSKRKELWQRAGSIFEDMIGNFEEAIQCYRNAYEIDPSDLYSIGSLERLYELKERWNELVEILRVKIEYVESKEEKIDLLFKIAQITYSKLTDKFEAIQSYYSILELDPNNLNAIDLLVQIFKEEERWEDAIEMLNKKLSLAKEREERIPVLIDIAKIYVEKLAEFINAIEVCRDILSINPKEKEAVFLLEKIGEEDEYALQVASLLEPLYREEGLWDKLIYIKDKVANITSDLQKRKEILKDIAQVYEEKLQDKEKAFEYYLKILKECEGDESIYNELNRLSSQYNYWDKLVVAYRDIIETLVDPEAIFKLALWIAQIYESYLNRLEEAVDYYKKAIENLGKDDLMILSALDRLYTRLERWSELEEVIERELALSEDDSQKSLFELRLAELKLSYDKDYNKAIELYQSVLERNPNHEEAIKSLENLLDKEGVPVRRVIDILEDVYIKAGLKEKVVTLYNKKIELAEEEIDKFELYIELTQFQKEVLGDFKGAFNNYLKALTILPTESFVIDKIKEVITDEDDWKQLVTACESIIEKETISVELKIFYGLVVASIYKEKLNLPQKAIETYNYLIRLVPDNTELYEKLELLLEEGALYDQLVDIYVKHAEIELNYEKQKKLFIKAAQLSSQLGDKNKEIICLEKLLAVDENNEDALRRLIILREEREEWEIVVKLLEQLKSIVSSPEELKELNFKIANYYIGPLKDLDKALEIYNEILNSDPQDKVALNSIAKIYELKEDWEGLLESLQKIETLSLPNEEKVELYKKIVWVYRDKVNFPSKALDYYYKLLEITPTSNHEELFKQIEDTLVSIKDWDKLQLFYNERIEEAKLSSNVEKELSYLVKLGELYLDKLNDTDKAVEIYRVALSRQPKHVGVLRALSKLHISKQQWNEAIQMLESALDYAEDLEKKKELLKELHYLYEVGLNDKEKSLETIFRIIELDKSELAFIEKATTLATELGKYDNVVQLIKLKIELAKEESEKIKLMKEMVTISLEKLKNYEIAVPILEELRTKEPTNTDILLTLSTAYTESGKQDSALEVLKELIEAEEKKGTKKDRIKLAVYRLKFGKALESKGNLEEALKEYENAYKLDMNNLEVFVSYGNLSYKLGDFDNALRIFRTLLLKDQKQLENLGLSKAEIYYISGDILRRQGDTKKAITMFQKGLEFDKNHEGCRKALEELKEK